MASHSLTLAWKIPWTEEPGRLQSMGLQRVGHNWVTSLSEQECLLNDTQFVCWGHSAMFIEWIPDHWVPCFFSLPWHDVSKFSKLCTSLTLPSWWSYRICVCVCMCVLWLSLVQLATLWTVAYQVPLSMAFSRQGYCSGSPFTTPGGLPDPGIQPRSPALAGGFFGSESLSLTLILPQTVIQLHLQPPSYVWWSSEWCRFWCRKDTSVSSVSACCPCRPSYSPSASEIISPSVAQ